MTKPLTALPTLRVMFVLLASVFLGAACRTVTPSNSSLIFELDRDTHAVHCAAEVVFDEWLAIHGAAANTTKRVWSGTSVPGGPDAPRLATSSAARVDDPDRGCLIATTSDATLTIETLQIEGPRTRILVSLDPHSMSSEEAAAEARDLLERIQARVRSSH